MHKLHLLDDSPRTFDEVSMETSKSFINALHELKSLRPQLYSAAEYCEKSYLNSEQKQMVLDNLKDYAVRALVNAVDHLGTVAYKLTDIFEQQSLDVSSMELKVSCLNRDLLTCQTYTNKEGLRQQQLLTVIPRHHKHYVLPNSVSKKVHFSPQIQTDARQKLLQAKPRIYPAGTPASKTLSWHLASETKSSFNGTKHQSIPIEDSKPSKATFGVFQLLDSEEAVSSKSSSNQNLSTTGGPTSNVDVQSYGVTRKDYSGVPKAMTGYRSFDNPGRKIIRAPVRNRSLLSAFLSKQKTAIKPSCISG